MNTSNTFGNISDFAITYSPCPDSYNYVEQDKMAICHITINSIIIGDLNEECYLPTWFFNISKLRNFIATNKDNLYITEFNNLSDREIFELIIKSNQLQEEFDKDYLHLRQLNNKIWEKHFLSLDETINNFLICYYIKDNKINFIVEKWWPETGYQRNIQYHSVELSYFLDVLESTISFLETKFPYLSIHSASSTPNSR